MTPPTSLLKASVYAAIIHTMLTTAMTAKFWASIDSTCLLRTMPP